MIAGVRKWCGWLLVCGLAAPVWADGDSRRTIEVVGSGEVKVVPDQAILSLAVQSFDPKLAAAKADNDQRVRAVLATATEHGVDEKDIQTSYMTISQQFEYSGGQRRRETPTGFDVNKQVSIMVRDLSKLDALLSALLDSGVNVMQGMSFQSSAVEKHQDEARVKAVQNAMAKAKLLLEPLEQRIGVPVRVSEGMTGPSPVYERAYSMAAADAAQGPTFSLGQITITANVSVTFEILPASQ